MSSSRIDEFAAAHRFAVHPDVVAFDEQAVGLAAEHVPPGHRLAIDHETHRILIALGFAQMPLDGLSNFNAFLSESHLAELHDAPQSGETREPADDACVSARRASRPRRRP